MTTPERQDSFLSPQTTAVRRALLGRAERESQCLLLAAAQSLTLLKALSRSLFHLLFETPPMRYAVFPFSEIFRDEDMAPPRTRSAPGSRKHEAAPGPRAASAPPGPRGTPNPGAQTGRPAGSAHQPPRTQIPRPRSHAHSLVRGTVPRTWAVVIAAAQTLFLISTFLKWEVVKVVVSSTTQSTTGALSPESVEILLDLIIRAIKIF